MFRFFVLFCLFVCLGIKSAFAAEQAPLSIYIPFNGKGPSAELVYILQPAMEKYLNRRVVVSPNDEGTPFVDYVKDFLSKPSDGNHILVGNLGTHASSVSVVGIKLGYDPLIDFQPVGFIVGSPMYLASRPGFPAADFKEMLAILKQNPYRYTIAHSGKGSTSYLGALLFMSLTKTRLQMKSYTGSGVVLEDLRQGKVDLTIDQSTTMIGEIVSRKLKGFLYMGASDQLVRTGQTKIEDWESFKDIDCFYDTITGLPNGACFGLTDIEMLGWNALYAPIGVDKAVIKQINEALRFALRDKEIHRLLQEKGSIFIKEHQGRIVNTPAFLKRFTRNEIKRWQDIARIAKRTGLSD